jgi:hypothetical protein
VRCTVSVRVGRRYVTGGAIVLEIVLEIFGGVGLLHVATTWSIRMTKPRTYRQHYYEYDASLAAN